MRQIVLDTETTGLEFEQGHRIIEIGCVEILNRKITQNRYHQFIQPDRIIDEAAFEVHGISNEFLQDKPRFSEVVDDFIEYIDGAELIIHNASFDVGFLNYEISLLQKELRKVEDCCQIVDTLLLAKRLHPGQKNNLDALCKRYDVDNSKRELHGALLDAEILADVYLAMTGGQSVFVFEEEEEVHINRVTMPSISGTDRPGLRVIYATDDELIQHNKRLDSIEKESGVCVWTFSR